MDDTVKIHDRTAARHEVECARIKAVASSSANAMVSSILIENGTYRAKSAAMLKMLSQRLSQAKKELGKEQQRVREEEIER